MRSNMVRAHIYISGKVQGVFFRAHMREKALKEGVKGWVRNLPDGRVEAVLEGSEEAVRKVIEWSRRGPPLARVDKVDIIWEDYRGEFRGFEIRYW